MMTLIFFLYFTAILLAIKGNRKLAIYAFSLSIIVSLFWLSHHASDSLSILL
ncbi:DUF5993 family protein [Psychromonas sp. CNPT3]|uniref:DUF5993 family protein n=1 Tax=Psychromonas sp. CNPT3 TaxID=314282 RepID=UPI00006E9918|nr:DUF5993 family protein [Psychromonas sp. CNPT3]